MPKIVNAYASYAGVPAQDGEHPVQAAGVRDAAGRRREDRPFRVPRGRLPLLARPSANPRACGRPAPTGAGRRCSRMDVVSHGATDVVIVLCPLRA